MGMRLPPELERKVLEMAEPAKQPARIVYREPGSMNRLEAAYAEHLEMRRLAGEILSWKFGVLKLRLAKATFYDTDFLVVLANGEVEVHETKGWMRDDAAVKLKVAAEMFPFRFILVQRKRKSDPWSLKEVQP